MQPKRILIVDDDPSVLELLASDLDSQEFSAETAATAQQALDYISQKGCPDVLVTDYRMPGTDGLGLAKQAHDMFRELPVILLTGHCNKSLLFGALDQGVYHVLEKPPEMEVLMHLLRRACDYHGLARSSRKLHRILRMRNLEIEELGLKLRANQSQDQGQEGISHSKAVAHELRSPLTVIKGNTARLRRMIDDGGLEPEVLMEFLDRFDSSVDKAANILDATMDLLNGNMAMPIGHENVVELIEDAISICEARLTQYNIDLVTEFSQADIMLECNAVLLMQVFTNLIKNAADAVKKQEERWILVRVVVRDDWVEAFFEDSGPGISEELQAKIFTPNFTTKAAEQGSGIGLSLCQKIIDDEHQGKISCENSADHTVFKVRLPYKLKRKGVQSTKQAS